MLDLQLPPVPATWLRYARAAFDAPPPLGHIVRPAPVGELVAAFVLPLDLVRPQNRTRHSQAWALAKLKRSVAHTMGFQASRREEPLPGRPMVRCCRFSSVEPDKYNDGFKAAIDVLCVAPPPLTRDGKLRKHRPTGRLGFLVDDSPRHVDLHCWWEPAPPKSGFGLIEVWTGTP